MKINLIGDRKNRMKLSGENIYLKMYLLISFIML